MQITDVKVFPVKEEKLRAYASIVFDHCFMVNDLKIIQGKKGLFISMPSRRRRRGGYRDIAHPLNNETRRQIEERVIGEYERLLEESGEALAPPPVELPEATAAPAEGAGEGVAAEGGVTEGAAAEGAATEAAATEAAAAEAADTEGGEAEAAAAVVAPSEDAVQPDVAMHEAPEGAPAAAAVEPEAEGEPRAADAADAPPAETAPATDDGAVADGEEAAEGEAKKGDRSLEEIEELHLRDSFWTVS